MTIKSELASLQSPAQPEISNVPKIDDHVPPSELEIPSGKPALITFLRHCGCPYAEKVFRDLQSLATGHPDINFIAVSHSSQPDTDTWLASLPDSDKLPGNLIIHVDEKRDIYAKYGLGLSSYWAALGPGSLLGALKLGSQGIRNRPTNSGYRLQRAGSFAIDGEGIVRWVHAAKGAEDMPDLQEAIKALEK